MSIFDPTLALTLLTHPFQVVLVAVTLGALVREGVRAVAGYRAEVTDGTNTTVTDVRAAA
jgi:hypothetical protein